MWSGRGEKRSWSCLCLGSLSLWLLSLSTSHCATVLCLSLFCLAYSGSLPPFPPSFLLTENNLKTITWGNICFKKKFEFYVLNLIAYGLNLVLPFKKKAPFLFQCVYIMYIYSCTHIHIFYGLPRQLSGKESACQCRRHGLGPWVGKIPWKKKWQSTPVFFAGKSHGQRSLASYSPWGCKKADMT